MIDGDIRKAVGFGLCEFAVGNGDDLIKKFRAHFLIGLLSPHDGREVIVHVVFHAAVRSFIGSHLHHRCNGVARRCAAARSENNHLAARGDHGGHRRDIVARGVHDKRAFLARALCLQKRFTDGTGAALADAAEALFIKRGKTARLIARRGLTRAAVLACSLEVIFVVAADFDDLVMNLGGCCSLGDHVFTADPFNRFAKNCCRAVIDQNIA